MKTLVTGGAGFIGSHIVEALAARGDNVRVLDNFSTGRRANLLAVADQIEVLEGDIRDREAAEDAIAGVEVVFHEAAFVSVPLSVADPVTNHTVNVDGTLLLLEVARHAGVRRLVYASSAAVYGDSPRLPKAETMDPEPISPYGLSKLIDEQYARLYSDLYGLETVGLRYFNVYGPRQDPSSPYSGVISIFVDRLMAGQRPTIYGDGEQTRDFVFVSDVVRANLSAAAAPARVSSGKVFNVSTGKGTSVLALWRSLAAVAGSDIQPVFAAERAGDVRHSRASYQRARAAFDFEPQVSLSEGLRRTMRWCSSSDGRR